MIIHREDSPHPIACTLSNRDMGDRVAAWADLGKRALLQRQSHPLGVLLHYRAATETEAELRRLIGLEGQCCAFLEFDLTPGPSELVLKVSGPPEAAALIQQCWGVGSGS